MLEFAFIVTLDFEFELWHYCCDWLRRIWAYIQTLLWVWVFLGLNSTNSSSGVSIACLLSLTQIFALQVVVFVIHLRIYRVSSAKWRSVFYTVVHVPITLQKLLQVQHRICQLQCILPCQPTQETDSVSAQFWVSWNLTESKGSLNWDFCSELRLTL